MLGLIQRVAHASVVVDGKTTGEIDQGILLLLGVQRDDNEEKLDKLINKVLNYRIFSDPEGKMNLSVKDIGGSVLVVSQFTLAADTNKGLRPSFTSAAPPAEAERLYNLFVDRIASQHRNVATGIFGANMQVSLLNDGPVTFMLET